jgi:hypothetical protein
MTPIIHPPDPGQSFDMPPTHTTGAPTVRVERESDDQRAIREFVEAIQPVIADGHSVIYVARHPLNDTLEIHLLRGQFNRLKLLAAKYAPIDPTSTPLEKTEVDET